MSSEHIKISIIIPCYNAEEKLHRCLESLKEISMSENEYEIIFVDDCSSDDTKNILEQEAAARVNWFVYGLDQNSGSPSKPRNTGLSFAKGEYVFFLDIDDEILPNSLLEQYTLAFSTDACIVRGGLIVDDGNKHIIMNSISNFSNRLSKSEKILLIIENQSTTVPSLIKRKLLINNKILWNENIRMGEDTLFLIDVLSVSHNIFYIDKPLFIYNKSFAGEASSTQIYGARELSNHLYVWTYAEEKLALCCGFSYFQKRGQVALQTVLFAIRKYYQGDIDKKLFEKFSDFVNLHWNTINKFTYTQEFAHMTELIKKNDYGTFFNSIKPKLVIAGYDLKFISEIIPDLEEYYVIKIDQWAGHEIHNEEKSSKLLNWADIIFCEWLFGNAVWYSHHKLPHQKLIVRLHRVELTRDYGHKINQLNVDIFITVGLYTFEKMIEVFNIARNKMRLIPNFIDTTNYKNSTNPDKIFNLGIVGILPARKGYLNALKLLKSLIDKDKKYNLNVFGKMPSELSWIVNNREEMSYFKKCEQYIKENNLENNVHIKGWVNTKVALADIGFVLSVSETENLPESFHIAPAEGFASGNQGVFLHWDGDEYLYPDKYIFHSLESLKVYILDYESFEENRSNGFLFVKNEYSKNKFIGAFNKILDRKVLKQPTKV